MATNDPIKSFTLSDLAEEKSLGTEQVSDLAEEQVPAAVGKIEGFDPYTAFTQGVTAGGRALESNVNYFRALGNSLLGNEKAKNDAILEAETAQAASSAALQQFDTFEEFLEEPTFAGFLTQAVSATGQFTPSIVASIVAGFTGAGVGAVVAGSALKSGGSSLVTGMTKKVAQKELNKIVKKRMSGAQLTKEEADLEKAVYGLLQQQKKKKQLIQGGAVAGAAAQEFPQGSGIAFGNFADQGMTDPVQAFQSLGIGVPFTAIGVGSEALVAKSFLDLMKKGKGQVHNQIINGMTKTAVKTGVIEGLTETAQEELSIQQKFAIDEEYVESQARLDRAQALFAGFFGGVGVGAGGGAIGAVIGKARALTEEGYQQAKYEEFNKERYGETEPGQVYKEPTDWLEAQFEAVFDDNNKKDSVYLDANSFQQMNALVQRNPELAARINKELFQSNVNEDTFKMGALFTRNEAKLNSFVDTVQNNSLDSGALDAALVDILGYAHNRKAEDELVVEVLDENNNAIWYQSTNAVDKASVQAKAAELFGKDANIVVKGVDQHIEERNAKLNEEGVEVRDIELEEEQQEDIERQAVIPGSGFGTFEPQVVAEGEGSEATPITPKGKQGWRAGRGRDESLVEQAREYVTGEYEAEFNRNINEGNYSDSLLSAFIQNSENNPGFIYRIDEAGQDNDGVGLFNIKKITTPAGAIDMNRETARWVREAKRNENYRTRRLNQAPSKFTIRKGDEEFQPISMSSLTNFGRRNAARQGELQNIEGDLATAFAGFNDAIAELLMNGYEIRYEGVPYTDSFNPQFFEKAVVYTRQGKEFTVKDLQQVRPDLEGQPTPEIDRDSTQPEVSRMETVETRTGFAFKESPEGTDIGFERAKIEFENREKFSFLELPIKKQTPRQTSIGFSEALNTRFGEASILQGLVNIIKNDFKFTRNLQIISADETTNNDFVSEQQAVVRGEKEDIVSGATKPLLGRILSGRYSDTIIINLPENATEVQKSQALLALMHELGHSVYKQEAINSLRNKNFYNKLLAEFQKAKAEVGSRQYEGPLGFEEWYADQMAAYLIDRSKQATNSVESFFKRLARRIQQAFDSFGNIMRRRFNLNPAFNDYVQEVTKSYREGTKDPDRYPIGLEDRIFINNMVEDMSSKHADKFLGKGFAQKIKREVEQILSSNNQIPRILKYVFFPAANFLESLGKEQGIGKELAAIFQTVSQSQTQVGLLQAKITKTNSAMNELEAILGIDSVTGITEEARAILENVEDNLLNDEQLNSEEARAIRKWLSDFYAREDLSQLGIGELSNYFPRLLSLAELENNPSKQADLVNLLVEFNQERTNEQGESLPPLTEQQAKEIVDSLIIDEDSSNRLLEGNEGQDLIGNEFNLGLAKERAATFKNIPTKRLREIGLLEDPEIALRNYISNTYKRLEYNKRGGAKKVKELISKLPADQQQPAIDAINALLGRVNPNMGNLFRFANSWALVANVTTLLAFAVFASLPDFAGPVLRSKEFGSMKNFAKELAAQIKNPEEAAKLAKDIGVVATDAINTMYINAGELDFMSKNAKQVSEKFFRYTGLEWYTKFTRNFAAGMGKRFILDHAARAKNGDKDSIRYLKELGINAGNVDKWNADNQSFVGNEKIKTALARFVEESIVRPDASQRPVWASDPRFALIWQLKSFFYAYGKNIIGGLSNEIKNRYNNNQGLTSASLPLLLAASTLLPLSMLGLDLRERFKIGLAWVLPGVSPQDKNYRRSLDMDHGEYAFEALDRSGALGPFTLAFPLFMESKRYGDPFWVSPLGPSVEKGFDLLTGDLDFEDMIPLYSQL